MTGQATVCRCHQCRVAGISDDDFRRLKADEAMFLLAPMMEQAGDHEGAQRQRDWALATYPVAGTA